MKLNLGCGKDIKRGYVNLDIRPMKGVDVVCDLNGFPYPFRDNLFDEIYCNNILEHLDDIVGVMQQLHRISKAKGKVIIRVPHFTCQYAFADPTHKHYFTYESFDYFTKNSVMGNALPDWYTDSDFRTLEAKLIFSKGILLPWNFILEWVANMIPKYYEGTFLRLFPAEQLVVIMEPVKNSS